MNEETSAGRDERLNAVLADYLRAVDAGQAPNAQELLARNPDLADELRVFLSNQGQLDRLAIPSDPAATAAATAAAGPGTRVRYIGDYEVLEELARGGMGVVFKARQVSLNRIVALKMILAGALASEADVRRFRAEAEAAAALEHPNILPIYEIGTHEGQQYFSMKLVEGGSLARAIADCRSQITDFQRQATIVLAQVARAVHHAHQRSILHRDLKPANILLEVPGGSGQSARSNLQSAIPLITDFGLAKRVQEDSGLTQSGAIVGTPGYMAPEQARGAKQLSTAVDVYSLGAILYEVLTGRPPFRAATVLDTIMQVLDREPQHPRRLNPEADVDLAVIALRCLEKDPAKRYESAAALANDLERWLAGEPIVARPAGSVERAWKWAKRRPAAAALISVSAAAALALVATLAVSTYLISVKQAATEKAYEGLAEANIQVVAEKKQTKQALDDRTAALAGEQRAAYFSRVGLAYDQWRQDNAPRARQLLDSCAPSLRGWEWQYLHRLIHSERVAIAAHPRGLGVLAFSPDGSRLVTGGSDGVIRLWDAWRGTLLLDVLQHSATVRAAVFAPDGKWVISCSSKEVLRWDAATGTNVKAIGPENGGKGLALRRDGKRLAVLGADKQARVFDPANKLVYSVPAEVVAFSPDGKLLATAASGVVLRDAATGKEIRKLEDAGTGVTSLQFSGDSTRLAAAGSALAVVVWDVAASRVLFNQKVGATATLSPDGQRLAVGGDRHVRFWDLSTGQELPRMHGLDYWVVGLAYSADGRSFATATADPLVIPEAEGGDLGAMFLQMMLASALKQGPGVHVRIWDAHAAQEARPLPVGKSPSALAFRQDGLLAIGRDGAIELWDLAASRRIREVVGHSGAVTCLAFTPDGTKLVSGAADKTTRVWDPATGKELCQGPKHGSALTAVVILPDGREAASTAGDETVLVWDLVSGKERWRVFGPAESATHLAVLDANTLLRCSTGGGFMNNARIDLHPGQAQLFDIPTTLKRGTLNGIKGYVNDLALSPDGRLLAMLTSLSVQGDGIVQFFDTASGREVGQLTGESGRLQALAFTPDGKRLAMAAGSNIKLWDVQDKLELFSLPGGASKLAFSPDGRFLVAVNGTEARVFEATPPAQPIEPPANVAAEPEVSNDPVPDPLPAAARQALRRGEEALANQDPAGALLWAVSALRSDPERAERYRIHIGLLLQSLPPLGGTQPAQSLTPALPPDPGEGQIGSTLSDDGRLIAYHKKSYSLDEGWIHVFDLRTGREAGPRIRLKNEIVDQLHQPVCFVPGGRQIIVSCWDQKSDNRRLRAYDIVSGTPTGIEVDPRGSYDRFWVTGDGSRLVVQGTRARAWDLSTGKQLSLALPFNRLSFSADGRFVLAASSAHGPSPQSKVAVVYDLRTGKTVGPGLRLPSTSFDRVLLSPDGQAALFVDDNQRQVRLYTVADGCCRLARRLTWNDPAVAFAPQGDRIAVRDGGATSIVEVRDVASGRLLAAPMATPNRPEHLQFSADGRLLVVKASLSLRLLDVETGLGLGPWLPLVTSDHSYTDLPDQDFHLAADGASLLTRANWPAGHVRTSRFRIWDLKPDAQPQGDLETLATLYAGRRLTDGGQIVTLSLDEYRRLWQEARSQNAGWFAAECPRSRPRFQRRRPRPRKLSPLSRVRSRRRIMPPCSAVLAAPTSRRWLPWRRRSTRTTAASAGPPWTRPWPSSAASRLRSLCLPRRSRMARCAIGRSAGWERWVRAPPPRCPRCLLSCVGPARRTPFRGRMAWLALLDTSARTLPKQCRRCASCLRAGKKGATSARRSKRPVPSVASGRRRCRPRRI